MTRGFRKSLRLYLLIGCILLLLSGCTFDLPSDRKLINRFNQNRQPFEQLIETYQLSENVKTSYTPEEVRTKIVELENKKAQLLRRLELRSASKDNQIGPDIEVIYLEVDRSSSGIAFSSAEKGYAYLLEKPASSAKSFFRTFENLNPYNHTLSGGDEVVFRLIGENWYLYFARHQN